MKSPLFAALLLSAAAQAQTVECPKFYPWQDTALAEVPYQHKGVGKVAKSPLRTATIDAGSPQERVELASGEYTKVKGGENARFRHGGAKWLVCFYGEHGAVQWWERLDDKTIDCTIEIRDTGAPKKNLLAPVSVKATCR